MLKATSTQGENRVKVLVKSIHIKHALMTYFRFERQMLCATEYRNADVFVLDGEIGIEIEVKISKSDLWNGEKKKGKHRDGGAVWGSMWCQLPNKFYICVPSILVDEAERWAEETNPRYGVIKYCHDDPDYRGRAIEILKSAKMLHDKKQDSYHDLAMRVCSENIRLIKKCEMNG
jgi:hypothetical protein